MCDDTQGLQCIGAGTTCACPTTYFFNGTACGKQRQTLVKVIVMILKNKRLKNKELLMPVGLGCDYTAYFGSGCDTNKNLYCNTAVTPHECV